MGYLLHRLSIRIHKAHYAIALNYINAISIALLENPWNVCPIGNDRDRDADSADLAG